MATIRLTRSHTLTRDALRTRVNAIAQRMSAKLGLATQWNADVLTFKRSGVNGSIALQDTSVTVQAELGFMLGALKGTIEKEIQAELDSSLGEGA